MASANEKIVIITAPSGAGKTSITQHLLKVFPRLAFSVSAATRARRSNETEGVDYYFMTVQEFQQKIQESAFVEWEMVYEGKYYGTLKSDLQRIWNDGQIPILDIDVKGAIHVCQQYGPRALSIFIQPPSIEELRKRLETRGTESPDSLGDRVSKASYEISFKHHFDHIIINDDLTRARLEAEEIVGSFLDRSTG